MKIFIFIFICFCTFNSSGQSQAEMNDLAMNEYSMSLTIKDSIVKEIRRTYQNDTEFLLSFEKTEVAWEKFVDKQFKIEFPSFENWDNRHMIYGSSFDMCYYFFLKNYMDIRIKIWKIYLNLKEMFVEAKFG